MLPTVRHYVTNMQRNAATTDKNSETPELAKNATANVQMIRLRYNARLRCDIKKCYKSNATIKLFKLNSDQ